MTLCFRLGDTSNATEDPLEIKEEPTPGLWWNQEQAGENALWIILNLPSIGFLGGLFNPWESGQARNWFQPVGEGEPTSIPEVFDNLNFFRLGNTYQPTNFSRQMFQINLDDHQVGLQEGAAWLPTAPPLPRLPAPVPRGPPVPMVSIRQHVSL